MLTLLDLAEADPFPLVEPTRKVTSFLGHWDMHSVGSRLATQDWFDLWPQCDRLMVFNLKILRLNSLKFIPRGMRIFTSILFKGILYFSGFKCNASISPEYGRSSCRFMNKPKNLDDKINQSLMYEKEHGLESPVDLSCDPSSPTFYYLPSLGLCFLTCAMRKEAGFIPPGPSLWCSL